MKTWQVQDAKQRFSELSSARSTRDRSSSLAMAKAAVVVLAADEYQHLTDVRSELDFKAYLASAPDLSELDLDAVRREMPRPVDL